MAFKTMDLYLIQSPDVVPDSDGNPDHDNPKEFLRNMLKAYKNSIPVRDIQDFVGRVLIEFFRRQRPIRKMVIGSHGSGLATGYGCFYIGKTRMSYDPDHETGKDKDLDEKLARLMILRPVFAPHADVYIMACKTGNDGSLLRKVSIALGGVRVHGYTDFVTATNYWIFGASVSDETDDGSLEIVCWPSECRNLSATDPRTGKHPRWNIGRPM